MKNNITGATGFVGQNLSAYLAGKGYEIEAISLRNAEWPRHTNPEATALIHLAGKAHDTSNVSAPEEYFKINRDLTIQVFDYFIKSEIRDFIFFSSVKAVADSVPNILDEEMIPEPLTPYGKSKLEAEQYILSQTLPKGKRVFILRPCMIHGPGNKGNLNLLYSIVKRGIPWPLAAFENRRSFLSIDNLSFLIDNIISREEIPSGVYNLADDEALSTNELIKLIASSMGRKPHLWSLNPGFMKFVAKLGGILHLPLNLERLKKLTEDYVVSNAKIKKALKIDVLPVNSQEGMIQTLRTFAINK